MAVAAIQYVQLLDLSRVFLQAVYRADISGLRRRSSFDGS
jgi:hypothetical protein